MSDEIRTKMIPEHDIFNSLIPSLSVYSPLHKWGLWGRFSPKLTPKSHRKPVYTVTTAKGVMSMPKMSKKRKLEWQFFLNRRNRMTYNLLCRKCVHGCKQSFRAVVMDCPRYYSKRAKSEDHDTV